MNITETARDFLRYMIDLHFEMENLTDADFYSTVKNMLWPECLVIMREQDKNMVDVLKESDPLELLCILKKFQQMQDAEKEI